MKKHMFSSELPRCVVEESWAAWQASRLEAESADSSKEKTPQETKRVCLFTEEELKQPVPARKKKLRRRTACLFSEFYRQEHTSAKINETLLLTAQPQPTPV